MYRGSPVSTVSITAIPGIVRKNMDFEIGIGQFQRF